MAKSDMRKYKRICPICSRAYAYCSKGCTEYSHLPRYMDTFDTENCQTLYNICAGFVNGWLSKEEEANRLKNTDLSYFDELADWMKEAIVEMKKLWNDKNDKNDNKTDNMNDNTTNISDKKNVEIKEDNTEDKKEKEIKVNKVSTISTINTKEEVNTDDTKSKESYKTSAKEYRYRAKK